MNTVLCTTKKDGVEMNKVILLGSLTKNPELRSTTNGTAVCSFTVAVQRRFKNQNGEREADFLPVIAWRGAAEACARYLHKGSKVAVCGTIQTRSYDAQDGGRRYVTEIVADEVEFLNTKSADAQQDDQSQYSHMRLTEDVELPF